MFIVGEEDFKDNLDYSNKFKLPQHHNTSHIFSNMILPQKMVSKCLKKIQSVTSLVELHTQWQSILQGIFIVGVKPGSDKQEMEKKPKNLSQ